MKKTVALILALVMTLALVACGGDKPTSSPPSSTPSNPTTSTPATTDKPVEPEKPVDPDAWKYGGNLIVGTANAWTTMDPHQNNASVGNVLIAHHIYEHLAIYDADGKLYSQVCDVEESADGRTVKFTLRERYFSNGKKITIEDVEASIRRGVALLTEANFNKIWAGTTMKIEGDTITFTLEAFNVNFLYNLCAAANSYFSVMPKEICDKYPVTGGTMQSNGFLMGGTAPMIDKVEDVIGSGTYVLTKYVEEELILSRNENYQIIENEAIGIAAPAKQYADTITIQLNKDASSRTAATIAGEYDVGYVSTDMQETAKTMGVKFLDPGTTWTHAIFFNLHESNSDSPIYNINIRKAIRTVLDCNAVMLSVVGGAQWRVNLEPYGVVNTTSYKNTKMEDAGAYNVANKAKALEYMAAANYDGTPIKYLTTASGAFYNAAIVVIPQLESIGLKVEMMIVDSGSHSAMRKDPKTGHDIGCWEAQKHALNPVMSNTWTGVTEGWWSSPARTAAMEIMNSTPTGSAKSIAAYHDFLDAVIEDVPYVIFGHPTGLLAYRENVEKGSVGPVNYYYWNDYFLKDQRK